MLTLEEAPTIGRIGPRRDGVDGPFWDGLAAGELTLQQCPGCGTWWWSPVWRCGECGSWDLDWKVVPPRGRIFSWIRTFQPFAPEMAQVVPYVTLLVELPDAGLRRLAGLLVGPEDGLEIGSAVEGVIQQPSTLTNQHAVLRWKLAGR
jgi:uncharacterized OB-fold protein